MTKRLSEIKGQLQKDSTTYAAVLAEQASAIVSAKSGRKNFIINGSFVISQRTLDETVTANGYTADRWLLIRSSNSVRYRQALLSDSLAVAFGTKYAGLFTTTATTGTVVLEQKMEGLKKFSGKTITLSLGMSAQVVGEYKFKFRTNYGTGGSPTGPEFLGLKNHTNASSYANETVTFTVTVPDIITGKVYGSNGDDFLQLEIFLGSDTESFDNNNVYITNVQVEEGPTATVFEQRTTGEELSLCQRYYQSHTDLRAYAPGNGFGRFFGGSVVLPVTMRVAPSFVWSNTTYTNSSAVSQSSSTTAVTLRATTDASTASCSVFADATLDAEL